MRGRVVPLLSGLVLAGAAGAVGLPDIFVRDPFILPVPETKTYYLFGTAAWQGGPGFVCYTSADLVHWSGPQAAFVPPAGFASENYWAPEVHRVNGKYYLLGTFYEKAAGRKRGTYALVSDTPEGPYRPWSQGPLTPAEWFALDGTLYRDPAGKPWLVFCHEWVEVSDGTVEAVPLKADLSAADGPAKTLFHASDAPWRHTAPGQQGVTDGPCLFRFRDDGPLFLLWSSFAKAYSLTVARAASGSLDGPWEQAPQPLYDADGGHAMVFRDFAGNLRLTLHQPNGGGQERAHLFDVSERDGWPVVTPSR